MRDYEGTEFDFAKRYMVADEYILWKGKPGKGKIFELSDLYIIPISIVLFVGLICNVYVNMLRADDSVSERIIIVLYVLIAFYILIGRFIRVWFIRSKSYYVITNRKIIRKRMGKIDTLSLSNMPAMDAKLYKNGYGTISFGRIGYYNNRNRVTIPQEVGRFSLENIEEAAKVQDIISTACNSLQAKAE